MADGRDLRLFASKALLIWTACLAGLALADGIYWVQHHRLPDASSITISIGGTAFVAIVGSASAMRRTQRAQRRKHRESREPLEPR
ncbi:hypothetical protein [Streptomyces hyaluromycini]|uniref:hypothetical protein n=1 Tax=Streptomyces hyaluromycini TaxID=1377993 RepID=UPI000B5C4E05|nr:hypothetical protein [Streptomyces hyaluromycini]